jgi:hypothetical protein
MKAFTLNRLAITVACAGACTLSSGALQAEDTTDSDIWQSSFTLYGWLPDINGQLKYELNLGNGGDAEVDASTILDALNFTFMGAFATRRNEWSFLADVIYLDMSQDKTSTVSLPTSGAITTKVDLGLKGWQIGLYGGYSFFRTAMANADIVAGARYFSMDTDAELSISGPLPPELPNKELSSDVDLWDGVVGIAGHAHFNEHWFVPYHFDVGAGESDLTWQAMAGIGYAAGWGDTLLTYRYLEWQTDLAVEELAFSGPQIGFKFRF